MKILIFALALITAPAAAQDRPFCHFVRTWQCNNGYCTWQEIWSCRPVCRRVCRTEVDQFGNTSWICADVCR